MDGAWFPPHHQLTARYSPSSKCQYFTYIMSMFEIFVIVCTALDHRELTTMIMHPAAVHKIGLTTPYIAGFLIKLVGTWLRFDAYRQLGPTYTFQLSIRKDHKLVTTGVYAIVRHPGYSGAVWFFLGTALCQMGRGSYWAAAGMWGGYGYRGVVFGTAYLVLPVYMVAGGFPRIWKEDEMLRALFKEEWEVWAKRTPYRLIPLIY